MLSSRRRPRLCSVLHLIFLFIAILILPNNTLSLRARASRIDAETTTSSGSPSDAISTETVLSNSHPIPILGVGAGNIPHQKIPLIISSSLTSPISTRLYDTSRSSSNEALVARAILRGMKLYSKLHESDRTGEEKTIHIVTKVWYTHLGYERTNLSVRESLNNLSPVLTSALKGWTVKIHVLLQWPRCYDDIDWMNCEEEEDALDEHTKSVGASPLLDREGAWKDSWKALEELYEAGILESIGISNFRYADMMELLDVCNVKPHIYQGNLWNLVFDKDLVELLTSNNILFQAYNVMNSVINQHDDTPKAFKILEKIASSYVDTESNQPFSVSRLLLAWLMQRGVGVVVGTSSQEHLTDNSPANVQKFPPLLSRHETDIETAVGAVLKKIDLTDFHYSGDDPDKGVIITFYNAFSKSVKVFLLSNNGIQVPVSSYMEPGKSNRIVAQPEDVFVVYDVYGTAVKKFLVMADHGGEETFSIEEQ